MSAQANHWLADGEPDEMLVFHYTKLETAEKILTTGRLRLGPYTSTNDPRETKEWVAEMTLAAGGVSEETLHEADVAGEKADQLLRRGARLACFTLDRSPRTEAAPGSLFHRGWARANMWAHYADRHRGACLVFRRDEIVGQVDDHRPHADGDVFSCGRVNYADMPLHIALLMADVRDRGIADVLDNLQTRRGAVGDLYFTKNSDWSSEQEFRVVVVRWAIPQEEWEVPLDIPFGNSLLAIVLGEAATEPGVAAVRSALERHPTAALLRCRWDRGAPLLEDLTH